MTRNLISIRKLKKYYPVRGGVFKKHIADVKAVDLIVMLSLAIIFSVKNSTLDELFFRKRRIIYFKKLKSLSNRCFSMNNRDKAMYEKEGKPACRQTRRTLIVYFAIIGAGTLLVVYMSRYVLFHPWTEREWLSAAAVSGKIYTAGGKDSRRLLKDAILMIDPVKLSISNVGSLPSPRFGTGAAGIDNKVVFLGGFTNSECLDEIVSVDPLTGDSKIIGRLTSPREYAAAVAIENYLYLIGGVHERFHRQLRVIRLDPESKETKSLKFRSFFLW